jgi:hypothetical protein
VDQLPLAAQIAESRFGDCADRVEQWLHRPDDAAVLSITAWGPTHRRGRPDRAYDAVVREADLQVAIALLEPLERDACWLSKAADRDERSWFRGVRLTLQQTHPIAWGSWVLALEAEAGGPVERPFELLLRQAAEHVSALLGPDWW